MEICEKYLVGWRKKQMTNRSVKQQVCDFWRRDACGKYLIAPAHVFSRAERYCRHRKALMSCSHSPADSRTCRHRISSGCRTNRIVSQAHRAIQSRDRCAPVMLSCCARRRISLRFNFRVLLHSVERSLRLTSRGCSSLHFSCALFVENFVKIPFSKTPLE